jgi:hypothetical protein
VLIVVNTLHRIRRIKCDEGLPACIRCTSTGRRCDGYQESRRAVYTSSARKSSQSQQCGTGPRESTSEGDDFRQQLVLKPKMNKTPRSLITSSIVELRGLEYCQEQLLAPLAEGLGEDFWKVTVLQAVQSSTIAKHAVVALGLMGDRLRIHKVLNEDNALANIQHYAAQVQYQKAITQLQQQLNSEDIESVQLTLTICVIMVFFEFLQGNDEGGMIHLRSGLNVLERLKGRSDGFSRYRMKLYQDLMRHFYALEFHASIWVKTSEILTPRSDPYQTAGMLNLVPPDEFLDIGSARLCLNLQRHDLYLLQNSIPWPAPAYLPIPPSHHQIATGLLDAWDIAFQKLVAKLGPRMSQIDKTRVAVLEVAQVISRILIIRSAASYRFRSEYREHIGVFRWILKTARPLIQPVNLLTDDVLFVHEPQTKATTSAMSLFAFIFGMIEPLYFVAIMSPIKSIAIEAIELLTNKPWREGAWDSAALGAIARRTLADFDKAESSSLGSSLDGRSSISVDTPTGCSDSDLIEILDSEQDYQQVPAPVCEAFQTWQCYAD